MRQVNADGSWAQPLLPRIMPPAWRERTPAPMPWAAAFIHDVKRLSLIASREWYPHDPEHEYLHISLAGPARYPTWDELVAAKELFFGLDEEALQVLPARRDRLNVHEHCLHLWCREGAPFLYEITRAS